MRIEQLERNNARLERNNARLERDLAERTEERDHWKHHSEHLEKQLAAAQRAGRRQAAPFAKDRRQGRGGRPGRRSGKAHGKHGHRWQPTHVDETHAAPLPSTCPDCGGAVELTGTACQYQEDLPVVRPLVRRFDIEVGHCSQCRRRVQGRHRLQTSDALGAAGAQLGPTVATLAAELHVELGMPLAKTARLLQTGFGLSVTAGGLVQLLHRVAKAAAPSHALLCEQLRSSSMVTPDETSWRVHALPNWLWAFTTANTTVYAICAGRGFEAAASVLGPDFAGVLVRDGWAAYRGFKRALHQTCVTHLVRRCKELQEARPDEPWPGEVKKLLQGALASQKRCHAGHIGEHGLATARGRFIARLARLIEAVPCWADAERFAKHLANEFAAVFLFCATRRSRPRTRAPSAPFVRQWSCARSAAATARARVPTRSRCWPASCAPRASASSTCRTCSARCCARPSRSRLKYSPCLRPPERAARRGVLTQTVVAARSSCHDASGA